MPFAVREHNIKNKNAVISNLIFNKTIIIFLIVPMPLVVREQDSIKKRKNALMQ